MILNDTITSEDIFLLKSINMDYVNFDKSFYNFEGRVYFNIDIDKLPSMNGKPAREIFKDKVFKAIYGDYEPDDSVEYYINYDPTPYTDLYGSTSQSYVDLPYIETFSAEFTGKTLLSEMYLIQTTDVRIGDEKTYNELKEALDEFNTKAKEWTCKCIRETIFSDMQGTFYRDDIKDDTYIHQRLSDDGSEYINYVLYGWWRYDGITKPTWFNLPEWVNFPSWVTLEGDKSNTYLAIDIEV